MEQEKATAPASLLHALEWRYAAKSFTAKEIPADTWQTLERALILTPSSYGLQPWQFQVVKSAEMKEQLRGASYNQRQVTECSHFIVFTARPRFDEKYVDHYLSTMAAARGIPVDKLAGLRKVIVGDISGPRAATQPEWNARQCYIALGNFMTAAALLGVDTCPMEGFDPAAYDKILGLEKTPFRTVVACAAGYRHPEDRFGGSSKVRFSRQEMIREL